MCSNKKLSKICAVCNLYDYRQLYLCNFGNYSKFDFVFNHNNGDIVTADDFRHEFKEALLTVGIIAKHPYWRPHSLRAGEISDMVAAGVPFKYVKKLARHTPDSKTTFIYIKIGTNEEATMVNNKYLKYFDE